MATKGGGRITNFNPMNYQAKPAEVNRGSAAEGFWPLFGREGGELSSESCASSAQTTSATFCFRLFFASEQLQALREKPAGWHNFVPRDAMHAVGEPTG
ncbi:MAG TPA: hypothetical protein DEF45_04905 [Rhodopirellula sp.]|nr:hypothetical protein [Rhodopirellula sp.]